MFSIVIPLYNKELSIESTIQSVLDQSYQDFEIVIINDGSTDKSVKIIEGFNDERIRLIHQKNQGVSAARNKGIEEAKSEWIALLDADDLWKSDHLGTFVNLIGKYPNHLFFASSFEYSTPRESIINRPGVEDYEIEDYFKESLTEHLVCTDVVVINKKCFEAEKYNDDFVRGEDIDLWARLARKYKIIKSNKVTAIYRTEAENRSDSNVLDIRETFFRDVDLSRMKNKFEKKYFKKLMFTKLKYYAVKKEWNNFFYLLRKFI
jgi:glycosyltransferase involved in cell wall biosynthesis